MHLLCFLILCVTTAVWSQSCNIAQNTGTYYNPVCTNPLRPYCSDTSGGQQCSACSTLKPWDQTFCDCPVNQWCENRTSAPNYGSCVNFAYLGQSCTTSAQCGVPALNGVAFYMPCVQGKCAACTQQREGSNVLQCGGSRPGENRQCLATGLWQNTGTLQTTPGTPPPVVITTVTPSGLTPATATTTVPSPTTAPRTSKATSLQAMAGAVYLLLILLIGVCGV